ncbi:hypothetical protein ACU4GH_20535 [Bradyrhizobium betae]
MLAPTLCSVCRSPARLSRALSGALKIAVTSSPASKALDRTDGFLNGVIVAVPFDWMIPREARDPITTLDVWRRALIPNVNKSLAGQPNVSQTAAVIAQGNAAAQNDAMISATIETGQRNMTVLEQAVIKDNTLLPGEWYGGQLHLTPPTDQGGAQKTYTVVTTVGSDRHVIDVAQGVPGA